MWSIGHAFHLLKLSNEKNLKHLFIRHEIQHPRECFWLPSPDLAKDIACAVRRIHAHECVCVCARVKIHRSRFIIYVTRSLLIYSSPMFHCGDVFFSHRSCLWIPWPWAGHVHCRSWECTKIILINWFSWMFLGALLAVCVSVCALGCIGLFINDTNKKSQNEKYTKHKTKKHGETKNLGQTKIIQII